MSETAVHGETTGRRPRRDRTHWLYSAVIVAVLAGILVGWLAPGFGKSVGELGALFVSLIKMMIAPVIFCTIVLGIGSVRAAARVGKVGGMAVAYFLLMSTAALAIGLVVGNLLQPGTGLDLSANAGAAAKYAEDAHGAGGTWDFISGIVPTTLVSSLTAGSVLQALFVALLVGFAIQAMGPTGEPLLRGVALLQKLVFRILTMILWLAPVGAFGAIANVVARTGLDAVKQLAVLMIAFYLTCVVFVFGVLGVLMWAVAKVSIFKLVRYLAREYLLIVATSSSESALPRLIAKMEHLGVERTTVGVVVPTGYSFNLDGTAIYLTMATLFIADAMGQPLAWSEQLGLLLFMIVASKGAAGVTGAGLATLAGGLQSHRPDLLDGVGIIVGIDRFMSEARALTNFSGNAVATVLVGTWTRTVDAGQVRDVLDRKLPFDETTMVDDHPAPAPEAEGKKTLVSA
ncbi:cation:dicarboxylase symporter family transporter [Nocardia otitidiscaviarum]|uniref:Cation:dicarboxylase symporter family transporter n=1 Tax=Nocardia otitidiscaviarum TaxID=1823 RepID=A0A516NGF0_9NOCA|nr:cation:dicarboxylase symporter family transporter [Nocardia otitidiscaviarum]MCP9623346.1 cation:dicarboxylase symporter family transporter [Nocardia otitidiscaviarum]QDP77970.1 cation:dicarboxylase symporter family transporter [Nocardia otitidiscaviarum]